MRSILVYSRRAARMTCSMPIGVSSLGRQEGGGERDVADVAAGNLEAREPREIDPLQLGLGREHALPDAAPMCRVGEGEVDDETQPPHEGGIERGLAVGRQNREPAKILHPLQQIVDLDIGVAVVAVLDLGALAEQRVGLVEEQDDAAALGGGEDAAQIALGLADIFADDAGEIDAVEIEPQTGCASTSAAMVLPVPLGPANSALMPRPRLSFAPKPQSR